MAATLLRNSVVWAYLRVSGDEQREKATIVGQRQQVIEYAHAHSLHLPLNYIFEDEAKPGDSTVHRDAFNRMIRLALATSTPPTAILLWSWSRFARDEDDAHYFKAALRRQGIKVVSVTDDVPIEDKGLRYVMESMIHWKDAERRKEMSREIKRGLHTIARLGYAPGGFPPRGYKAEKLEVELEGRKRKVRRWVADPEYAPKVKKAWQMKKQGYTDREIHRQARLYKSMSCYATMWRNKTYLGIRKCGDLDVPDAHEPLVDRETWEAVQKRRKELPPDHPLRHPRRKSSPHLLSGLLFCGYCKAPLNAGRDSHRDRKKAWRYYRCSNLEKPGRRCPKAKKMSANVLETVVIAFTKDFLSHDRLAQVVDEMNRELAECQDRLDLEDIQRDLARLDRSIDNLLCALEEGALTEEIKARLKKREAERVALLEQLRQAQSQQRRISIEDIEPWTADLEESLSYGPIEPRRNFLRRFIHRIEVYRERGIVQYALYVGTGGTHDTLPGVLHIPPVLLEARISLVAHR